MQIAIPPRKGLLARKIAAERPELTPPPEIARLAGTNSGHVVKALKQDHFGRQKPKSRAKS